jgi:hypothetical protein
MPTVNDSIVAQIMQAQDSGEPEKVYRKAIVGKVIAQVIDPFSGSRTEVLITGVPGKVDNSELEISLWTPMEVKFFERFNKGLIENGSLVVASEKSELRVNYSNALSDEELAEVVTSKFFSMQKTLSEITSETTMQRLLAKAKELNRPSKTVQEIELRLEEIQQENK